MPSLADLQSDFIASLRDPAAPPPDSLVRHGGKLPRRRFDVYRNNVAVSLIEALGDSFPAVLRLVGEDFFKAAARAYIEHEPPRSPLLFLYGREFGSFLDAFPPAASVPYLGDVARLEWARLAAYHAEDRAALTIDCLAAVPAEELEAVSFTLHPSLTLISSRWPLFSLWAASTDRADPNFVDMSQAQQVAVIRPDLEVETRLLPDGAYRFVEALQTHAPLSQAAERALGAAEDFDLARHIEGLFGIGAVVAIESRRT